MTIGGNKMTKKLFAFDIDGTLLDKTNNQVPQSALNTIRHLRKQGHIVGASTGRNQSQLRRAIDPKEFDFCIICNGGYLEINGEKVYDIQFSLEQKGKLCDLFDHLGLEYGITTEHHLYAKNPNSFGVQKLVKDADVITPELHSNLRELPVYQFTIYEGEEAQALVKHIEGEYNIHASGGHAFDIVIPDINKGKMLHEVAKIFHIDMKDTIAFGDSDNDRLILKEAGIGVAMGNASERTKLSADFVTTEAFNDGIYNGVKTLGYIE